MMKNFKLILLTSLLFLSGCVVTAPQLEYAQRICEDNRGIHLIIFNSFRRNEAVCKNGVRFKLGNFSEGGRHELDN